MLSIKTRSAPPAPGGVSVVKTQSHPVTNDHEWRTKENSRVVVEEQPHEVLVQAFHEVPELPTLTQAPISKLSRSKQSGLLCATTPRNITTDLQSEINPVNMNSNSIGSSSTSSIVTAEGEDEQENISFVHCVRNHLMKMGLTNESSVPIFDKGLREVIEPFLRIARKQREMSRNRGAYLNETVDATIASSVGVPYTILRSERRFLYDEHTHPLHLHLSELLGVEDLSLIHQQHHQDSNRHIMAPLLDRYARRRFHECYDSFVTSFCIPLLHSLGMQNNIFHTTSKTASNRITYRYQAFPTIQILRPGHSPNVKAPHCAGADGHSIGCLTFHIPLSPAFGTNAMHVESYPGREDWHPLTTKSVGLGYLFDGARCLHFDLTNTTDKTRVSIDFTVLIYREGGHYITTSDGLCCKDSLEDAFSLAGPGYYEEATIDLGVHGPAGVPMMVAKKKNYHYQKFNNNDHISLLDPDHRNGFPFA